MKTTIKAFTDELYDFLKIDVKYNTKFDQYLFKGQWTYKINDLYFENRLEYLRTLLFKQLKEGQKNKELLLEILDEIKDKFNFFQNWDYNEFAFFEHAGITIGKTGSLTNVPPVEKYSFDYFQNERYLESSKEEDYSTSDDEIYNYRQHLAAAFNAPNATKREFEQSKLMYCIINFVDNIRVLQNYVESLYVDYDYHNFSANSSESFIIKPSVKCQVNLSKIETAQLFKFLFMEQYITIQDEDTSEEAYIKKFIELNFTYQNQRTKKHENIKNINKQFSELETNHKESQIKLIDNLISKLQARKEIVKEIINYSNKGNSRKLFED